MLKALAVPFIYRSLIVIPATKIFLSWIIINQPAPWLYWWYYYRIQWICQKYDRQNKTCLIMKTSQEALKLKRLKVVISLLEHSYIIWVEEPTCKGSKVICSWMLFIKTESVTFSRMNTKKCRPTMDNSKNHNTGVKQNE